jgi:rhodanese-related sulfurtransferase
MTQRGLNDNEARAGIDANRRVDTTGLPRAMRPPTHGAGVLKRMMLWLVAPAGLACTAWAHAADFKILVSIDPSDRRVGFIATAAPASTLAHSLGAPTLMLATNDLKDSMRATRTSENRMIIGPAHVTASALSHGYTLAAVSGQDTRFALVVRSDIASAAELRGTRLYLPQQDSLRSYVAKGLLEQVGLSFKAFRKVDFQYTSGAGLIAVSVGLAEATVSELKEAETWLQQNPGKARILQTSREIPGGLGMALHKSVSDTERSKVIRWATSVPPAIPGLSAFQPVSRLYDEKFAYVASLGILTPDALAGVTRVSAEQVRELAAKSGIVIVDTRSSREFGQEHIPKAVSAPYGEKSLKERDYDVKLDDLTAIAKLDRDQPTVFLCNGPECWKSYKACSAAAAMGFKTVYWFRGGMPEWRASGFPTVKSEAQGTLAAR